ncbi:MAG: hypothetical protein QG621_391 [Patescibacteria group bacterium]|nr:hypothetical protein [Patescibacteria group bacterium]
MRYIKIFFYILVGIFAVIGLVFTAVFVAMRFGLLNVRGSIQSRNDFFSLASGKPVLSASHTPCIDPTTKACAWSQTPEWAVIKAGLTKDAPVLQDVSFKTGVPERLIAAVVVPEQMRFFTAEREILKRYFEPLKILGSLSQFSLGVSGIKQDTARTIEMHAASTTSPFYPGAGMSELIAYEPGVNRDTALYDRLTDEHNHYYSYLYTALFIKEIEAQWEREGYSISQNPGAIVTLFNVGFHASRPNANPQLAGATIETGNSSYTYGELGQDFYDSAELSDIFPH